MALLLPNASLTASLMLRLEVSGVEYKNILQITLNDAVREKRPKDKVAWKKTKKTPQNSELSTAPPLDHSSNELMLQC